MCGIIAVYSQKECSSLLYKGMRQLQHRGQDAAGITTLDNSFFTKKSLGTVDRLLATADLQALKGNLGIGHVRYRTSGGSSEEDSQPFQFKARYNIALAHSGHLQNCDQWLHQIPEKNRKGAVSTVDSNLLLHLLSVLLEKFTDNPSYQSQHEAQCSSTGNRKETDNDSFFSILCATIKTIFTTVQGSYSVVSLIEGKGLVIFRDPKGVRPLVMGERMNGRTHKEYIVASESACFNDLGYALTADVAPGELIYITEQGRLYQRKLMRQLMTPCSFEYIYFAHSDSIMNGLLVKQTRQAMGVLLALRWKTVYPDVIPDFVLPIPNTAKIAALSFAKKAGFNYTDAFQVNQDIGRTFISSATQQEQQCLADKLSINADLIKDKIILVFDDSIVRGTTAKQVIKMLRDQGAKKIYFVSACPPLINICEYGINIPTREELLASDKAEEKIRGLLGVDKLLYPNTDDLIASMNPDSATKKISPCIKCMRI